MGVLLKEFLSLVMKEGILVLEIPNDGFQLTDDLLVFLV